MCGRLVNLDTVARVIADYYHLKTETQLSALDEALSKVPAVSIGGGHGKDHIADPGKMVGDVISRQAALDVLAEWNDAAITNRLNNLPPAKQERKKGKWIYNSPVTMKCNQCGFVIKDWDWHRFKYCPNCIADMRGESDG